MPLYGSLVGEPLTPAPAAPHSNPLVDDLGRHSHLDELLDGGLLVGLPWERLTDLARIPSRETTDSATAQSTLRHRWVPFEEVHRLLSRFDRGQRRA
jgi:hypothetical protein